jgi:hypothetical protein
MRAGWYRGLAITSTGIIVVIFAAAVLSGIKYILFTDAREGGFSVTATGAKSILPDDVGNYPGIVRNANLRATFRYQNSWFGASEQLGKDRTRFVYVDNKVQVIYDPGLKKLVQFDPAGAKKMLYAGPAGVSERPDDAVGSFEEPLANAANDPGTVVVFDKGSKCFYAVDFEKGMVRKSEPVEIEPVQVGVIFKGAFYDTRPALDLFFEGPYRHGDPNITSTRKGKVTAEKENGLYPVDSNIVTKTTVDPLLVLDRTGKVYRLDRSTLKLQIAGVLACKDFKDSAYLTLPQMAYHYTASAIVQKSKDPVTGVENEKYLGLATASVDRYLNKISVAVFDANGKSVSAWSEATWAEMKTEVDTSEVLMYCVDALNAPVLNTMTFLFGSRFEASAQKSLFTFSNSVLGQVGDNTRWDGDISKFSGNWALYLLVCFVFISPSIIISGVLVYFVRRNAKYTGLSRREIKYWTAGTFMFGACAFITYWITKPAAGLVTCGNCGQLRRTDFDECNVCKASWEKAQKASPGWRVVSGRATSESLKSPSYMA